MAFNTASVFDIICRLDRDDTLDDVPQNKKQKAATGLLLDKLRKQDFAGPLACRDSKVLGPISRHHVADTLPHMKIVSRASGPGLHVGFLRILCNGLCTAQRFHTVEHDHTCRIGCPDEPDSLTHHNECPRLDNIFLSFWRHATILPQRNHFLHDLITPIIIVEIRVTNVLTMPLHLAHLDSSLTTTLPHAGFIITLTLLCVLMAVTTSARSWNDCSTFEQMQRRFIKTGVSVVFSHRVHRVPCAFHVTYGRVWLFLSAFSLWILASPNK